MTSLFHIACAIALIVLCTLLPFLPGRHDGLAVPLALMAQIVGTAGLALAPVGALWMIAERSQRLTWFRHAVGVFAFVAASLVWALVALAATAQSGFALGGVTVALGLYTARRVWPRFTQRGRVPAERQGAVPLALILVPVTVAVLQQVLVERATTFSRNRAIGNSAPLIAAIEQYRAQHGRYPLSLLSVNPDYSPGLMGIPAFQYEPHGDAYNLFFEQFSYRLGTREFVMYNPRDEHVMTSHAMDLLELTPEQLALERTRGHYLVHNAPQPHWRYFWFD
jgi:hypothetical protein